MARLTAGCQIFFFELRHVVRCEPRQLHNRLQLRGHTLLVILWNRLEPLLQPPGLNSRDAVELRRVQAENLSFSIMREFGVTVLLTQLFWNLETPKRID